MKQLADTGISSYTALQKLIYTYVEKDLFKDKPLPPRTRRRYFPNVKDIQNFLTKYKSTTTTVETVSMEGQIPLMDWEDDGTADTDNVVQDANNHGQIVNVTFQPPQVCIEPSKLKRGWGGLDFQWGMPPSKKV